MTLFILNRRLRTCTPLQSIIDYFCKIPSRYFLRQNECGGNRRLRTCTPMELCFAWFRDSSFVRMTLWGNRRCKKVRQCKPINYSNMKRAYAISPYSTGEFPASYCQNDLGPSSYPFHPGSNL